MTNSKTFYQCNFYDDVFGLLNHFPIPTSQTRSKSSKLIFKEKILSMINGREKPLWPYKGRILITLFISGPSNYVNKIDIDNVIKNLFDIFKGKVFDDDSQIYSIMASKEIMDQHGFVVGIRQLRHNEINYCIPPLMGETEENAIGNGPTKNWHAIPSNK